MIKKREAYRPFAPSVLEEHVRDYFELPDEVASLPYMTFVVPVRADRRSLLGAVTHVDGTARVQTVSRTDNERFWQLIDEFGDLTGVPVLLNTSFNNNAEPIVDSLDDAVICYLTTGLDYLVAGDYLVTRRPAVNGAYRDLTVAVPELVAIRQVDEYTAASRREQFNEIYVRTDKGRRSRVSDEAREILRQADGSTPLGELFTARRLSVPCQESVLSELQDLWARRLVHLRPAGPRA